MREGVEDAININLLSWLLHIYKMFW